MIMQSADLYGIAKSIGDYGIVSGMSFIKRIQCFLSFGTGNINTNNQVISKNSTHTAITKETDISAGMWLHVDNAEYLINAVNPAGRFTILYLQAQGGVSNAD